MYNVIFLRSGIVAYSNSDKGQCSYWLQCNNFDSETGDCLHLFKLIKVKNDNKD
jgi:hypothetical protein